MKEEHTFDQYAREVRKYKRLTDDILYNTQKVFLYGLSNVGVEPGASVSTGRLAGKGEGWWCVSVLCYRRSRWGGPR